MSGNYPQDPRRQQWQPPQWDPEAHDRTRQPQQYQQGYQFPPPQQQYAPQPPQPPAAQPQQPAAKRKGRPLVGCLTLIVAAAIIAVIIAVATSGSGPSPWKATVGDSVVINPADLAVTVHVTNTGSTAATPTCTVQASDPSGTYTGFDQGTLTSPVQAGQTTTYVDNVTITHEGAQYVTSVTVSC